MIGRDMKNRRFGVLSANLVGLVMLMIISGIIVGCSSEESKTEDRRYFGWQEAKYANVKLIYPAYHVYADKMQEYARLYSRQIEVNCRLLQMTIPAETLVVYHYTGFGQGRELTGREYPFAEDSVIHFWTPSYWGTTIMHYLLPKWIDKEPRYSFLKHGLYLILDASGKNYHQLTWRMVQDSSFIPLMQLSEDTTVNSNLELKQSAEAASFVDFMLCTVGAKGLAFLYRGESSFDLTTQGLLKVSVDSLQTMWLIFAEQAAQGKLPQPPPSTSSEPSGR